MGVVSSWAKIPVPACLNHESVYHKGESAKESLDVHITLLFRRLIFTLLLDVQSSQLGSKLVIGILLGLLLLLLQAQIYQTQVSD